MRTGRPTLLTPEVQQTIVSALLEGMYRVVAAQLAGIGERTLYLWLEKGEAGEAPYADFLHAVKTAEAHAELEVVRAVRAGEDGWQSKAWVAERRWPKRWAARVRTAVTEELDAYAERLAKRLDEATMQKVLDASREDAGGESPTAKH